MIFVLKVYSFAVMLGQTPIQLSFKVTVQFYEGYKYSAEKGNTGTLEERGSCSKEDHLWLAMEDCQK